MGKLYSIANCRTILECAELEVHLVFGRRRRTTDFESADVAKRALSVIRATKVSHSGSVRVEYRMASHKAN